METIYRPFGWLPQELRNLADTTYISHRNRNGVPELLLHTGLTTKHLTGAKERFKHSGVLRIKKDRIRPNTVDLHMTLFRENGRDDIERWLSRAHAGSMFAVPGYDLGKTVPLVRTDTGASHAVPNIFVRDDAYVNFCGGAFKLTPELVAAMNQFLRTWTFPPPQVRKPAVH